MNIAIFTDTFEPQVNGVVSYVVDMAGYLVRHGHNVLVVAPKLGRLHPIRLSKYPFKVHLVSSVPAGVYPDLRISLPNLPQTMSVIRRFKADIIHVNHPFTLGLDGIAVAKIMHIPAVVTFHSFYLDSDMIKNMKFEGLIKIVSGLKHPLSKLNSSIHNFSDMVICPSKEGQRELIRYGLKKPSVVIPNGIRVSEIQRRKIDVAKLRRRFGLPQGAHTAVFVGRVAADKSINVLLRAWKKVIGAIPNAHLLIIGFGPMEQSLKKLAVRLGVRDNVRFLGKVERQDLLKSGLYRLGEIYVSASKIENQSIAMIEAMAHGLPIVGVAVRGTKELVTNKTGILVTPDNPAELAKAVVSLFSRSGQRTTLARNSQDAAKQFDSEMTGRQLVAVYKKLYADYR